MSPCIQLPYGVLCTFNDGVNHKIVVRGIYYYFEFSEMFGPSRTLRNGELSKRDMPLYVYDAISLWCEQGNRLDDEGCCIWDKPPDPLAGAIHIGGRYWYLPAPAEREA